MEIIDPQQLARFAAALVFVLALMAGLGYLVRRFGQNNPLILPQKRRLKLVESLPLDSRRRLVLLRRDSREHLVILGPGGETLIESGIESAPESPQDGGHEAPRGV